MTDEDDEGAEVIRLPTPFAPDRHAVEAAYDEIPVRTAGRDFSKPICRHRKTEVSRDDRRVTCRGCGAVLDPIQVLLDIADHSERLVQEGAMLAYRVKGLREELPALERQERNAKARIRAARKRRGDERAVEAAMEALYDGHRLALWEGLPASLREDRRREFRPALEAYVAALAGLGDADAETA